jgi:hypothetical protein
LIKRFFLASVSLQNKSKKIEQKGQEIIKFPFAPFLKKNKSINENKKNRKKSSVRLNFVLGGHEILLAPRCGMAEHQGGLMLSCSHHAVV